ncbi:hypothetical protein BurJ1DRAFT_0105 [Burkholderiales bacterium JOSHI_001]|nr:hypothetical protein BurJ1DRAFT_0105 [Burkholderiales bacterium JOSHI_001]
MQRHALMAAMVAAGLLAACGGGGGGDTTTPPVDTTPSTTTTISLSGVAAKGLMNKAQVTAHKVKADGSVDDAVLAGPVVTDDKGAYTLSVPTTKGEPYVIKVTATAETTHKDEVTGLDETLPAGFTMRSVQVAPSTETATVTTSVTPFSEMTAKAAETATGGFTKANAEQAKLAVTQLLGFDPASVSVKAADASGASDDEKKMALMLTAVAQMASSGALGCAGDDNGTKTKCVVETLAKAAKTTSVKLEDSSGGDTKDVSAALATAVNTVVSDDKLSKGVPASVLTTVVANLGCSGDSCNAATSTGGTGTGTGTTTPTGPTPLQLAIVEAKLWFGQLTADWKAMFKPGGADTTTAGTVNLEANKFRSALTGIQVPAEAFVKDLGSIASCIDLYNDFKAGRTTSPTRSRAFDLTSNDGSADFSGFNTTGCQLFQDSATTVTANAPGNANFIGISSNFFVTRSFGLDGATTTRWRHGFTLTPTATAGEFTYTTRARRTSQTCLNGACGAQTNVNLQLNADGTSRDPFTGTVTTSTDASGSITAYAVKGQLAASFVNGGNTLANDHLDVDVAGTRSLPAAGPQGATLAGKLVAVKADGSVDGTVTIKTGSVTLQAYEFDANFNRVRPGSTAAVNGPAGNDPASLSLNLVYTNAGGEFEGLFSATDPTWDKSNSFYVPTKLQVKGALRTVEAGVAAEFLSGTFTVETTGYGNYIDDHAQFPTASNPNFVPKTPSGPENFFTVSASFVGQVTAPGRPLLQLKVSASKKSYLDDVDTISMQYSAIVNGTPRTVVNFGVGQPNANGERDLTLTELASGLTLKRLAGADTASLSKGDLALGTFTSADGRVTFVDSSFISLSLGL